MIDERGGGVIMDNNSNKIPRPNYGTHSDPNLSSAVGMDEDFQQRHSSVSVATTNPGYFEHGRLSGEGSPMMMSPWNQTTPFTKCPWSSSSTSNGDENNNNSIPQNTLIGSLMREEGHIYSLAASGDLLYTGSDSKNIRVWKNLKEFSAFKSSSGLVKAIIVSSGKIFTGHQDGKIRVWKVSPKAPSVHKRAGSLPTLKDIFKSSINPNNYIEVKKRRNSLWIKHSDAVSCLALNEDDGLLYSASWDRTIKVWRMSDSKCLESISSHDDAVNVVVATVDGLLFSGSADGTVKVWKCEMLSKGTKHTLVESLLKQESAVTSLTVTKDCTVIYCGSSDGLVNFWERQKQSFSHGGVLRGHKLAVLCLTSAGGVVFSGSADKTICVWRRDGAIHTCLSVLTGHTGPVKCLAVEEDPETKSGGDQRWILYSGSLDKSVKVWSVSELAIAPADVNNNNMGSDAPSEGSFSSHSHSHSHRAT